jgi:DNA-binding transcriptional regulator YbjK
VGENSEVELVAQEVRRLAEAVSVLHERVGEVEQVNARLEVAALSTARAMAEISSHWDAVYEAMRREELTEEESEQPAHLEG